MKALSTDVIIVGAGPSGLLLSQLLYLGGVQSIIVERTSRERVLARIRAGVLERGTLEALAEAECDARLRAERIDHGSVILGFDGDQFEIPIMELTGHYVTVYGQTEITSDLIDKCESREQQIFWNCPDAALDRLTSNRPVLQFTGPDGATEVEGRFIAGCDGFRGVCRSSIPAHQRREYEREYPFGWLGVMVDEPPVARSVIYANHQDGFALASMRSETRSRYYVQTAPGDTVDDWPVEKFWDTFTRRLGSLGQQVKTGVPIEMSVAPLRSYVSEPMSYGALFLAGDAAHIVPPTGAKGLNLAFADTRRLARAFIAEFNGNSTPLINYSTEALQRVWKVERFSWYLTTMTHQFPKYSSFEKRMQRAEYDYIRESAAAQQMIAENYVGLDF